MRWYQRIDRGFKAMISFKPAISGWLSRRRISNSPHCDSLDDVLMRLKRRYHFLVDAAPLDFTKQEYGVCYRTMEDSIPISDPGIFHTIPYIICKHKRFRDRCRRFEIEPDELETKLKFLTPAQIVHLIEKLEKMFYLEYCDKFLTATFNDISTWQVPKDRAMETIRYKAEMKRKKKKKKKKFWWNNQWITIPDDDQLV